MIDDPVHEAVHLALAEDLRESTDLTTEAIVPADARGSARVVAKQEAILAGTEVLAAAFMELDHDMAIELSAKDGDAVRPGDVIATVRGSMRAILTAERTALNFVQRLSGVATLTRRFVEAAGGVEVRDTRKTVPGIRVLQKAAVRAGGGANHRMSLSDAYLIKDNHIAAAGSVTEAIGRARAAKPTLWIEVECETLDQVRDAIEAGAHELLLDNMDVATLRDAVDLARGKAKTEASGNVTLETIGAIAATGVDSISVGSITHSAPAIDFSLEVEPDAS
ncbi:MAG TPA: carboxylating nicotinate-nucleotide diphosphorylase [Actinomycetota bacterium]|nr:carboxylating nicotinate-nucleotide diphosphorylase [Actinomycetota bacterium]